MARTKTTPKSKRDGGDGGTQGRPKDYGYVPTADPRGALSRRKKYYATLVRTNNHFIPFLEVGKFVVCTT